MKMLIPLHPSKFLWHSKTVGAEIVNQQVDKSRDWNKEMTKKEIWEAHAQSQLALDLFAEGMDIRNVQKGDTVSAIAFSFKKSKKIKVDSIWGAKVKYEGGFTPTKKQINHWNIPSEEVEKMKNGEAIPLAYANFLLPGQFVWIDPLDVDNKTIIIGKTVPNKNTEEDNSKKEETAAEEEEEVVEDKIKQDDYEKIKNEVLSVNHPNFDIKSEAIVTMGEGWVRHKKIVRSTVPAPFQEFFITDKNNPENPRYYLVLNPDDPEKVSVGKFTYNRGTLKTEILLDKASYKGTFLTSKPKDVQKTIMDILDQLP